MVDVSTVAEDIYMIDEELYSIPKMGSVYLIDEGKKVLIDAGPTTSAQVILDGMKEAGVKPEDIDYLIVTHIHLDHAGGAGFLLKYMPQARVIVHPRGIKHLVNPEKLIRSAIDYRGEESVARDGEVVPVEEQRIQSAYGGDVIELSEKQVLTIIYTPGHVPHAICLHESRNGGVFAGDAVGSRADGIEAILPSTPPPQFDCELYVNTLDKLAKLNVSKIYFSHFGVSDRVQEDIKSVKGELKTWGEIADKAAAENALDNAAERISAHVCAELEPIREEMKSLYDYWADVSMPMSAAGYMQYYREKRKSK